MKVKKYKICYYGYLTIIPFFCVMLDLVFSTISPDDQYGTETINFDCSIINQAIYFSVWVSISTSIYGLVSWIAIYWKGVIPKWAISKNNETRVVLYNIYIFIIFNATMLLSQFSSSAEVIGFNTWYKIIKSTLEHIITPIIIVLFYFLNYKPRQCTKEYAKKWVWMVLVMPMIYLLFITIRYILLINYYPKIEDVQEPFTPFPYEQISPENIGWFGFVLSGIGFSTLLILSAVGINVLSNTVNKNMFLKRNANINK